MPHERRETVVSIPFQNFGDRQQQTTRARVRQLRPFDPTSRHTARRELPLNERAEPIIRQTDHDLVGSELLAERRQLTCDMFRLLSRPFADANAIERKFHRRIAPVIGKQTAVRVEPIGLIRRRSDQRRDSIGDEIEDLPRRPIHVHSTDQHEIAIRVRLTFLNCHEPSRLCIPQIQFVERSQIGRLNLMQRLPTIRLKTTALIATELHDVRKVVSISRQFTMLIPQQRSQ